MNYDLIIIGAGSAGLPCAIRAAQRGLTVLVIEKENEVGGTLHVTAGHMSAGGTKRQKSLGIKDNPDKHWKDVQHISKNTADEVISKKAIQLAPSTIDWLEEMGYCFHEKTPLIIYGHEAYSVPRTYFGTDDYFGGPIMQPGKSILKAILPCFEQLVAAKKITLLTNHLLKKIILHNDKVIAVEIIGGGKVKIVHAKNFVLTTGGYASNKKRNSWEAVQMHLFVEAVEILRFAMEHVTCVLIVEPQQDVLNIKLILLNSKRSNFRCSFFIKIKSIYED